MNQLDPTEFIIRRKRKKYRFALFYNSPFCFEIAEWTLDPPPQFLEIGAGTALFSVARAEQAPDKQHVAVDVKADRLQAGARVASTKKVANLRFLRARADQLPGLFLPYSLESIWITFPDPFPKDHTAKRRLTHPRFLSLYASLLQTGGKLSMKTDAIPLFNWSLEQLTSMGWVIEELSVDLHNSALPESYKLQTTYEERYHKEGAKIHFVCARPPKE
jgi:tRNA (guanine-N7-)-methyltransferase